MKSITYLIGLFIALSVQTAFISSLPSPWNITPFFIALTIYLVQHRGLRAVAFWLPIYGIFLDWSHLGTTGGQSLVLAIQAFLLLFVTRHIFPNRSFYGMLATGVVLHTFWGVATLLIQLTKRLSLSEPLLFQQFGLVWLQGLVLLWLAISVIYMLTQTRKRFLFPSKTSSSS